MKKLLFLLAVTFQFLSCSAPDKESEDTFNFNYAIDTVMVESKDHFFFLNWNLAISDVDEKNKLLYNLNPETLLLEVIDLEKLQLKETIQLEKEGPNGVGGGFIVGIDKSSKGDLFLMSLQGVHQLDAEYSKVKEIQLDGNHLQEQGLPPNAEIDIDGIISENGKFIVAPYNERGPKGRILGLAILEVETGQLQLFPADFLQYLKEMEIYMVQDGRTVASQREAFSMKLLKDKVIISSEAKNELWIYDRELDSLYAKAFQSTLTADSKPGNYKRLVESMEEFNAEGAKKGEEVHFYPFIHDGDNNVFWRISVEGKTKVLSAFDESFDMLGEKVLEENIDFGSQAFLLDGTIYQFLNIADELAFVRLKPSIVDQ